MKSRFWLIVAVIVLSTGLANAQAPRLFGTLNAGATGGPSILVEIDPATGALVQTIGSVGYLVNGMTYAATTGILYGTTSNNDVSFPNGLITIDMTTGAGTPIGTGAGQYVNVPAADSVGNLYGWTEASDDLVLWNTGTGTVTVIGDSDTSTWEQGLAFDNSDVLYLVNGSSGDIYTLNTATGGVTPQGTLSTRAHHGDFHPTSGLYYGIDNTEDTGPPARILVVCDLSTQSVVNTIPTVDLLHTLTFVGDAALVAVDVPTISGWGIFVMVLAIGAAGVIVRRFVF